MSGKQAILEALQQVPDEMSEEDILEHLAIMASIRRGMEDIAAGRLTRHEDVEKESATWITKSNGRMQPNSNSGKP